MKNGYFVLALIIAFSLGFGIVAPIIMERKDWSSAKADQIFHSISSTYWNVSFCAPNTFWVQPSGEKGLISASPRMNTTYFWEYFTTHTDTTFWIKNQTGTWRNITSRFSLGTINQGRRQKLTYDIDIPYRGTVFLNFTFKTNVTNYTYNAIRSNYTLYCNDNGNSYVLNYNFSDIASLPNFVFNGFVKNNKFTFSVQRTVPAGIHLKLDPTVSIAYTDFGELSIGYSDQRKLARSSNGVLFFVYAKRPDGSTPEIYLSYSRNNGSTWTALRVTQNETNGKRNNTSPAIAMNDNDEIYIVWNGEVYGYPNNFLRFRRFFLSNMSFSTKIINVTRMVSDLFFGYSSPSIVVDLDNNAYISWCNYSQTRMIRYYESNNSFSKNTYNITPVLTGNYVYYTTSLVDSSGNGYFLWRIFDGNQRLCFRKFWVNNGTLNSKWLNLTNNYPGAPPSALIDKNDVLHLIFTRDTEGIAHRMYWLANNTWNPKTTNVSKGETNSYPVVSLTATNNLSVLYVNSTNNKQWSVDYTGSSNTWGTPSNLKHVVIYGANSLYAFYPNMTNVQTNSPMKGYCAVIYNITSGYLVYLNSSRVDYGVPSTYGSIAPYITDQFEYDGQEARMQSRDGVIRVNDSNYYISTANGDTGTDFDGFVRTLEVWSNGTVRKIVIDTYEYNISDVNQVSIYHINGTDKYVIGHGGAPGTYTGTFEVIQVWENNGTIRKKVIDKQATATVGNPLQFFQITDHIFTYSCSDSASDGWIESWWIDYNGSINNTVLDTEEFDEVYGSHAVVRKIDTNTIAIVYASNSTSGDFRICTYNMSNAGIFSETPCSSWTFDTKASVTYGTMIDMKRVSGHTYVIVYTNETYYIYAKTLNISDDGRINKSWVDTVFLSKTSTQAKSILIFEVNDPAVWGNGVFGLSFLVQSTNMRVLTWNVSADGKMIDSINSITTFYGGSNPIYYCSVLYLGNSYYARFFTDDSYDGFVQTFVIRTGTVTGAFRNQGFWNASFMASLSNKNQGYWNISFMTHLEWKMQGYFNVSFKGQKDWMEQGFWNVSFGNESKILLSNPYPSNGSNGIPLQPTLRITLTIADDGTKVNLTWMWGNGSSCPNFLGTTFNTTNGTKSVVLSFATTEVKTYYWKIFANDGHGYFINQTYSFTTSSSTNAIQVIQNYAGIGIIGAIGIFGVLALFWNKRKKRRGEI